MMHHRLEQALLTGKMVSLGWRVQVHEEWAGFAFCVNVKASRWRHERAIADKSRQDWKLFALTNIAIDHLKNGPDFHIVEPRR